MSIAPVIQNVVRDRINMVPLTVEQYHQMLADGILREGAPIELIDGFLVHKDRSSAGEDPMTVGFGHALAVGRLGRLTVEAEKLGSTLRVQQPISLLPDDEPEPDAALCSGMEGDFADHHPSASEITCVIEVADSSLAFDRNTKQRLYATHGIGQYVIVNLIDHVVEEYLDPRPREGRYAITHQFRKGATVELRCARGALAVVVDSLLPPV